MFWAGKGGRWLVGGFLWDIMFDFLIREAEEAGFWGDRGVLILGDFDLAWWVV